MSGLPPDPTGLGVILGDPEVRRMVGDLVARKLKADLAALRGGAELVGRWRMDANGAGPAATPGQAAPGEGVIKELVRLHLEYYSALVDMTAEFHERTRALLGVEPPPDETAPAPDDPEMRVSAPPGSTVRAAFRVENTTSGPMTVELVAGPFHREGSDEVLEPAVAFDPPRIELTPGQEEQVTVIVPVADDLTPGATYRGAIAAAGVDAVRIAVVLEVAERPEPPARPARTPAAKKPAAPKAAPKKPAARKPAAKKPASRKPAAKKAAPRKPAATAPAEPGT